MFTVNGDGTISHSLSIHLVLGFNNNKIRLVSRQSKDVLIFDGLRPSFSYIPTIKMTMASHPGFAVVLSNLENEE